MEGKSREEIKGKLIYIIKTFGIVSISQYILKNEGMKFYYDGWDEEAKFENEEEEAYCEEVRIEYELLKNDIDIINMINEKISEFNYEEINSKECAKTVYGIAALLVTDLVTIENEWDIPRQKIIEILERMNSRDFITTLELSGMYCIDKSTQIMDVIKERIPQMSENEFLRIYTDFYNNGIEIDDEMAEFISEKAEEASIALVPKYFTLCDDKLDVINLLDRAGNTEKIEAIMQALMFLDEDIDAKINQLIEELSDEQIVRLMVAIRNHGYKNEEIDEVLLGRVKQLKKEDIELIVMAYARSMRKRMRSQIIKIAIEKGVLYKDDVNREIKFTRKEALDDEDLKKKKLIYQEFSNPITNLVTIEWADKLDTAVKVFEKFEGITELEIRKKEEKIDDILLDKYEMCNKSIDITETIIDYVKNISAMSDKEFVKAFAKIKAKLGNIYATKKNEEVNKTILKALNVVVEYLKNRLLEIQDKGAIALLSILQTTDNNLFDDQISVKLMQCMDKIKLEIPDASGR